MRRWLNAHPLALWLALVALVYVVVFWIDGWGGVAGLLLVQGLGSLLLLLVYAVAGHEDLSDRRTRQRSEQLMADRDDLGADPGKVRRW